LLIKKLKKRLLGSEKKTVLRDACEHVLTSGGKRFRPAVVLMMANAQQKGLDASEAALAIEFFHSASLIADDLPCMDDDDERRKNPTVHKVYGEAVALLASYALIAGGYELLQRGAETIKRQDAVINADRICVLAVQNVSHNTGLAGACTGQLLDVFPPDLSKETVRDVIQKKTGTLFEIAFVLGWLYGGGAEDKLELVKELANHFGMAFQIADDFGDVAQDAQNERKINMVAILGQERALQVFQKEMDGYQKKLKELEIQSEELCGLAKVLEKRVNEGF